MRGFNARAEILLRLAQQKNSLRLRFALNAILFTPARKNFLIRWEE